MSAYHRAALKQWLDTQTVIVGNPIAQYMGFRWFPNLRARGTDPKLVRAIEWTHWLYDTTLTPTIVRWIIDDLEQQP